MVARSINLPSTASMEGGTLLFEGAHLIDAILVIGNLNVPLKIAKIARIITSQKTYGCCGLKHHIVDIRDHVTRRDGTTN